MPLLLHYLLPTADYSGCYRHKNVLSEIDNKPFLCVYTSASEVVIVFLSIQVVYVRGSFVRVYEHGQCRPIARKKDTVPSSTIVI